LITVSAIFSFSITTWCFNFGDCKLKMKNWPREGWKWLSNIANSSVRFHGNVATVAAKHNRNPFTLARPFGSAIDGGNEVDLHRLTREFLANLWIDDRKMANPRGRKLVKSCGGYGGDPRWFSASSGVVGRGKRRPGLKQPPISQSVSEFFEPLSPLEVFSCP